MTQDQHGSAASLVKIPRWLVIDAVVNPASAAAPNTVGGNITQNIPSDADFEWWWILCSRTSGLLKVQVQEFAAGNRSFVYDQSGQAAAQGMFVDLLAGLATNNGAMPETVPYVMPANRKYAWNFTDLSGAANTVEVALSGYALLQIAG